uniref:formate hydrogenlyase n=1 Tax=uncultured Flavonifractor sp. TaxID=1193534 RepID=UPI002630289C|nr:formate hydrogenlyase [uncultured Flavonifractor sp.]
MTKKKHDLQAPNFERRARRAYTLFASLVAVLTLTVMPALAASGDDPLTVVNNLSEFIFSLIRAIGLILLGFGVLQLGLSLKSHDPSQRANGMLTIAGGIVITFTKEILTLITG